MARIVFLIAGLVLLCLASCEEIVIARPSVNSDSKYMFLERVNASKKEEHRVQDGMRLRRFQDGRLMITDVPNLGVFRGPNQARLTSMYLPDMYELDMRNRKNNMPIIVLNNNFGIPFMFDHAPDMDPSILDGYAYVCSFVSEKWQCKSYGEDETPPLNVVIMKKADPPGFHYNTDIASLVVAKRLAAVVEYDFGDEMYPFFCGQFNNCDVKEYEKTRDEKRGLIEISLWNCNGDRYNLCDHPDFVDGGYDITMRRREIKRYDKLEGLRMSSDEWDLLWTRDQN